MNTFRPTEFMNHTVDDEIRPKVGLTERNQPKKRPEINAPPVVRLANCVAEVVALLSEVVAEIRAAHPDRDEEPMTMPAFDPKRP